MTAPGALRIGARDVAIDALIRVEEGAYANLAVPALLTRSRLDPRERAMVVDLVYGTVRMRRAVDHLVTAHLNRPIDALDPDVRAALRLGAYQLLNGVPAHAAVGETVGALGRRPSAGRGLVNAVLRRVATDGPPWVWPDADDASQIGVRTSHPDWIVQRLVADLGPTDAEAVLLADNEPAAMTLRVDIDTDTESVESLAAELEQLGARVQRGRLVEDALVVSGVGDPARLPAVRTGRATPQDQASQAVVAAVGAQPGERIADLAAAPGGKSTALARRVGPTGLVVAADVHPNRLGLVRSAAHRLALTNLHTLVADGRAPALAPRAFDRVLLDAPCSGLGVLRRRPDARWRIEADAVEQLAALQRQLLANAATLVRPGGLLAYSVCTLTAAETLGIDRWAEVELPGFEAVAPPGEPWRPWGRGALLLPHLAGTDGMFLLLLRAGGDVEVSSSPPGTLEA